MKPTHIFFASMLLILGGAITGCVTNVATVGGGNTIVVQPDSGNSSLCVEKAK